MPYFVPDDTKLSLGANPQIDNYALYLQRLAFEIPKPGGRNGETVFSFFYDPNNGRHPNLQKKFGFNGLAKLLASLQTRQTAHLQALYGDSKKQLTFQPDWRMIVGLGGASVYETSITLHHVYGIPYIPASAVKGVTRSCWIQEEFGYGEKDEEKALKNDDFRAVFGGPKTKDENGKELPAKAGEVVFFDAFPLALSAKSIEVDIMNPHYSDYYGKDDVWPTDTQNPVPVHFLTVANTTFSFVFGCRPGTEKAAELLDTTGEWLKKALTERGIGAKSSVGYGYMNPG